MSKFLISMILLVSSLFGAVALTNTGNTIHFYLRGYEEKGSQPRNPYYYDIEGKKCNVVQNLITPTTKGQYFSYVPSSFTLMTTYNGDIQKVLARGDLINYNSGIPGINGRKMKRAFIYGRPDAGNYNYKTYSMENWSELTQTVSVPETTWGVINDIIPNTLLSPSNRLADTVRIINDGDCLIYNSRGFFNKVSTKYVYVKNTTSTDQTITYSEAYKGELIEDPTFRTRTKVIPKDSIVEVIGLIPTSTISIGSVSVSCVLGDRIVISDNIAVEKMSISKTSNPLTVYPNPCNGTLNVKLNSKSDIRIFTLDGKLVQSYKNVSSIKADALLNGVYVVSAKQGEVEQRRTISVVR